MMEIRGMSGQRLLARVAGRGGRQGRVPSLYCVLRVW
jgi:hypothetical protein